MPAMRRVVVMIDLNWPLAHHFHVFAGIDRYARESGKWDYNINPHADLLLTGRRRGPAPDGILARATPSLVKSARAANVPVVNVWLNSRARGVPSVLHDAEESGRMAARHMLARGFRRFAYLGIARDRCSVLQLSGFRATLIEAGYDCNACWVSRYCSRDGLQWQRFQARLGAWIDAWTPPLGVFATHDLVGRYVVDACQQHGLNVPSDVALLGSFNEPMICNNPKPTLSSIDFGFEAIGYRAAKLLDQMMDGAKPPEWPILVPPADLVVRESSNLFAADDPVVSTALKYIADHVCSPIAVDDVARHAAVTRRTLARSFQKTLGKSIHQTITHLRLERVKRELLETKSALKSIAERCGYRDAIHLCKVFQREENMAPSAYRALRTTIAQGAEPETAKRAGKKKGREKAG
ncbi:MAG: XylR family transcriptional regulator [Planctomycetes bacterium]|nr:XylR family transcriptional regulator [Planctomycetota bacterium]